MKKLSIIFMLALASSSFVRAKEWDYNKSIFRQAVQRLMHPTRVFLKHKQTRELKPLIAHALAKHVVEIGLDTQFVLPGKVEAFEELAGFVENKDWKGFYKAIEKYPAIKAAVPRPKRWYKKPGAIAGLSVAAITALISIIGVVETAKFLMILVRKQG